jgi:thiamine-phosphate pyrophosphorylase
MPLPSVYPILDTSLLKTRGLALRAAAEALLQNGARILQLRHKGHWSRAVWHDAEWLAALCQRQGVLLVVNDRSDIARMLNAALHLGQDDLPPQDARGILGHGLIGFSTHNEAQLRAAANEPVDYLALGPLFATGSKQNPDPVVGVDELRRLRPLTTRPLVAIGGITLAQAAAVYDAGADSIALISDLFPSASLNDTAGRLRAWLAVKPA